ncbi:tryptophan halogenase family protein [uncultured Sphingomonas sp.]|uniref:tryptophan halogenase family protein n=1 Tax=uncultured Sphingomonas sp. TaxID=158754 RepID=UPI0025D6CF25|nr:tryptophan halogenase family protein [uncultured Sphingomonas sp.]
MGERRISRVVIAGGGTAGWVAAAALVRHLGPLLDITLVESDAIGTVGVGESTIPTSRSFHGLLGIYEDAFIRATNATFKLGISFENWGQVGDRYFHAFGTTGRGLWMADFQHLWLAARAQGFGGDYYDYSLETQAAQAGKFRAGEKEGLSYAYHLDATAYAKFLRGLAEPAGVKRVEGRIQQVERDGEGGDIAALVLENGTRVEGDLFIDCTGFRALLIEQTLHTGFDDWSHWLATDSALAVQTVATGPAVPYTRAIAHRAGWRWRIPLQHRVGNGLVYSSAFMEEDEARSLLKAEAEGEMLFEPRLIRYRTGARKKAWNRNCVALGLAGGFIEPLESTSIHLIKVAVTRLIQQFPFGGITQAAIDRYNDLSRAEWEHIRDFIILHYHATRRDDSPFWRRCREMAVPDTLQQRIALFRETATAYQAREDLFRSESWVQVLRGQGIEPASYHRVGHAMPPEQLKQALFDLRSNVSGATAKLPSHEHYLARYAAEEAA